MNQKYPTIAQITGVFSLAILFSASQAFAEPKPLKTDAEKFSYTVGYQIGQSLKRDGVEIDISIVSAAIKEVLDGKKPRMTTADMKATVQGYQQKKTAAKGEKAKKAEKAGKDFLAANKKKSGVKVLKSGLQYKIIKEGKGAKPKSTDKVEVHYKGTLISGKEFDSSYSRKKPATFQVKQVIKGWQEILPMMPTGSKWQIYVPSDLAYGPRGAGASIGPGETLIFDIELLSIKTAATAAATPHAEPKKK